MTPKIRPRWDRLDLSVGNPRMITLDSWRVQIYLYGRIDAGTDLVIDGVNVGPCFPGSSAFSQAVVDEGTATATANVGQGSRWVIGGAYCMGRPIPIEHELQLAIVSSAQEPPTLSVLVQHEYYDGQCPSPAPSR